MKFILLVLAFVMPLLSQGIDASKLGGLRFSGNYAKPTPKAPVPALLPVSKRSLFDLSPDGKIKTGRDFRISLNLSIWDNRFPGQVFKLAGDRYTLAMQYSPDADSRRSELALLINGKPSGIRFTLAQENFYEGKWFPVDLYLNGQTGEVRLSFSGREGKTRIPPAQSDGISLRFGRDISGNCLPMEMKDLRIFSENELLHRWLFTEMSGDIAYDPEGGLDVKTVNCEWLINRHYNWEPVRPDQFLTLKEYSHLTSAPEEISIDTVKTRLLNLRTRTYTLIPFTNFPGIPVIGMSHPELDSLLAFNTGYPDKPLILNFRTGNWLMTGDKYTPEGHYYGAWSLLDPRSLDVYIFGGYGWYTVKNSLIKYNKASQRWDTVKTAGEKPNPVYLYALLKGKTEGEFWITGGMGNESGKQEDTYTPQWDLFRLDLKTLTWQKKWSWSDTSGRFGFYSSTWADPNQTTMYTVTSIARNDSNLFEVVYHSLDDEKLYMVGKHLPYLRVGVHSARIYADVETGILYFNSFIEGHKDTLPLYYTIRTPFLNRDQYNELLENSTPVLHARRWQLIGYVLIGMVSISIPAVAWAGYRRMSKRRSGLRHLKKTAPPDRNYLTLFGGLKIVNAGGVNIHDKLTPGLAELFALIYFHTVAKKERGIRLDECARLHWTWIEEENINNNRKVSFLKLRRALQEHSGIMLDQKDDLVRIVVPDACNDEMELLFDILGSKDTLPDPHSLDRFLQIISRGELLAGLTSEWVANERNNTVSRIIQRASGIMKVLRENGDHARVLEVAVAVSTQDPLSEEILKQRIASLMAIGEDEAAKRVFSRFVRDYSLRYGEDYPYDMDEFTGQ